MTDPSILIQTWAVTFTPAPGVPPETAVVQLSKHWKQGADLTKPHTSLRIESSKTFGQAYRKYLKSMGVYSKNCWYISPKSQEKLEALIQQIKDGLVGDPMTTEYKPIGMDVKKLEDVAAKITKLVPSIAGTGTIQDILGATWMYGSGAPDFDVTNAEFCVMVNGMYIAKLPGM